MIKSALQILIVLIGAAAGVVAGFYTTLAIVVAKARAGYYVFAVEDLVAFRLETVTIVLGLLAGGYLAYRMPYRSLRAVLRGLVGLVGGVVVGGLLGLLLWRSGEGVWSGAIIGSALAFLVVTGLALRAVKSRALSYTDLGATALVGLAVLVAFIVGLRPLDPVEVPPIEPAPLPARSAVDEVVFIIGDAGATKADRTPLLEALRFDIEHWSAALARDSAVSVVYAGDLVYPVGVRDRDHPAFPQDSTRLWNQIALVGGPAARRFNTLGLFVPGNHDWGNTNAERGLDRIVNLSNQLSIAHQAGIAAYLVPEAGGPGPYVRDLRDNVRFVILDTHWFLRNRSSSERAAFLESLAVALDSAGDRHVIIVTHHPYQSAGPHGTIVPGFRSWGVEYLLQQAGAIVQDLNSPVYEELLQGMKQIFASAAHPPLVFAGGHDHSLQVIERQAESDPAFMLVSGAGSKVSSIRTLPGMHYGAERPGYMMLLFRKDGAVDLFVIAGEPGLLNCIGESEAALRGCMTQGENTFDIVYGQTIAEAPDRPVLTPPVAGNARDSTALGEVANVQTATPTEPSPAARSFAWWTRQRLPADAPIAEADETIDIPPPAVPARVLYFRPDSVVTTAGASYLAGPLHRFMLGDLNRHLWDVPVRLPVLDLDSLGTNVTVDELTGGMQTVGLRLTTGQGQTYQFRNIVKVASRSLESEVARATVGQVLEDQLAAQFPLGAMIVAELLQTADILVARPRPVVMPNDERLGDYRPYFAGRVGWIELRPNELGDGRPGFAGSRHVVGGKEIYEELREDPSSYADATTFLRARLIDFLVGDWDRHSDNWRWARFDEAGRTRWAPIPRDRDWAFARSDGLASKVSPLFFERYVGFSGEMPPMDRLAASGYRLDHRVLGALPRAAYMAEAAALQQTFSDAILRNALSVLPPSYQAVEGDRLLQELQARRALLPQMADAFYELLARSVHVYGFDGVVDTVRLEARDDNRFRVRAWTENRPDQPYFDRTMDRSETREVKLYFDPDTDVIERPDDFPVTVEILEPGADDPEAGKY